MSKRKGQIEVLALATLRCEGIAWEHCGARAEVVVKHGVLHNFYCRKCADRRIEG